MTQTASRTSSAQPAAVTTASGAIELNLGRGFQAILNKAANARQVRLDAEKVEDPLKKQRMQMIIDALGGELPVGTKIVVKALGVVRGTVTWRPGQPQVDLDLLLSAYPEAYTACVSRTPYPQYDPA